ncbi:MAG: hypothetical protein AAGJ37_09875 [Pseudomonadota bacterium]
MKVPVLGAQQQSFINYQHNKQTLESDSQNNHYKAVNVELIKRGDLHSFKQADMLFNRANAYANMTMQAQRMLSGYQSVALDERKETIRQMLGVDLYA